MADAGHKHADRILDQIADEVERTYLEAQTKAAKTLKEYLASFEKKDKEKKKLVKEGKMTEKEYRSWRRLQVMTGKRYTSVLEQVAWGYEHANEVAAAAIEGKLPEVYAENANFAAFDVCQSTGMAIAFDLVSAEAVQRSIMEGADLFPRPSVNAAKDVAWNRKLLSSQLTQGLLLGESMQKIARRIQNVTNSNYATAIRTARTTVTAAENAGRVDSYQHAKDIGVAVKQQWLATIDNRTRHSHRQLDGEIAEVGEEFSNGCKFPGDPNGSYAETMNCRCALVPWFDDDEDISDLTRRFHRLPEGMTYEQWKAGGLARKKQTPEEKRRAAMKPVNEKLYASQKNYVERHGGIVLRGGIDSERYLDNARADAANFGDVIILRKSPTTSEVLEEVYHFKQHKRGDYAEYEAEEMVARREIDAQKYLIEVAKRYNIPESETEQTRKALREYKRKLEELVRRNREG